MEIKFLDTEVKVNLYITLYPGQLLEYSDEHIKILDTSLSGVVGVGGSLKIEPDRGGTKEYNLHRGISLDHHQEKEVISLKKGDIITRKAHRRNDECSVSIKGKVKSIDIDEIDPFHSYRHNVLVITLKEAVFTGSILKLKQLKLVGKKIMDWDPDKEDVLNKIECRLNPGDKKHFSYDTIKKGVELLLESLTKVDGFKFNPYAMFTENVKNTGLSYIEMENLMIGTGIEYIDQQYNLFNEVRKSYEEKITNKE